MTNRKTTKKALLGSLLALVLCFAMLVGTTFAWFTDNEVLSDNKIQAGTLDIEAGVATAFKSTSLWEPGYSEPFAITLKNVGSLWLKYELNFANVAYGEMDPTDGTEFVGLPSNITEVLDVYVGTASIVDGKTVINGTKLGTVADLNDAGTFGAAEGVSGILAPKDGAANLNLVVKMQETAGNEYNGDWCTFDIVVNATQWTEEEDGFGNDQYDVDAEMAVAVQNEAELAAALGNGQNVIVTKDFDVVNTITVTGDAIIDLEGNVNAALNAARPFTLEDGATLTINAGNKDIQVGEFGLVNIPANGSVILNGGNYTANTNNGAFIKIRDTAGDVKVVMNGVNYADQSANGFIINAYEYAGDAEITINGSTLKAFAGIQGVGDVSVKDSTITTEAAAFEITDNAIIDNCTIAVVPGSVVGTAPAACVAVSNNGYAKVTNCELTVGSGATAYAVYSSGGKIDASNNTNDDASVYITEANSTITIDGDVYTY